MTCYFDAVHELVGGQIGGPTHGPVSKYRFHDGQTPPSEEEIQTKLKELQTDYNAKQYQRDRNYPDIGEQLDMLWHAIDNGEILGDKSCDFFKTLKKVKDDNPKPE
jgi:hypothetical protein